VTSLAVFSTATIAQWDFHYYDKVGLSAHGNVACHWKAYNF